MLKGIKQKMTKKTKSHKPSKLFASWELALWFNCPNCKESVDLLEDTDFWYDQTFEPCEHNTDKTIDVDIMCPKCGNEYVVSLAY